jgi:hypothetical protein
MSDTLQDISASVNKKMVAYIDGFYNSRSHTPLTLYTLKQELPLKLTTEENTLFQTLVAKPWGKLYEVTFEGVTVVDSLIGDGYNGTEYAYCDGKQMQVVRRRIISAYHNKQPRWGDTIQCNDSDWQIIKSGASRDYIYDPTQLCLVRNTLFHRFMHRYGGVLMWGAFFVVAIICALFVNNS